MKKVLITIVVVFMGLGLKVSASDTIFSSKINSINGTRYENHLVYFDYATNGSKTPTNQWGYEVAFNSDGIAVEINTNVSIPKDGFVLSGHGTKKEELMKVKVGDIADVNLDNMNVTVTRDELSANKFMANIRLKEVKEARDKAYNYGFRYNEKEVDDLIKEIEEQIEAIENASLNESNSLIKEINELADMVIYKTSQTKIVETRAVWHRPYGTEINESSLGGITRLITKFKSLGFNTIFLETFWNGYASYRSEILETHPRIGNHYYGDEYGFDYVKAFIGEANKVGIDVHAWMHVFSAGSPQYKSKVVKDEWLVENYEGNKLHPNVYGGSFYYDPSNPEVLDFVESVMVEIAKNYNFAGIQYDYIRYYDNNFNATPIRDSGYGENAEKKFKEAYNLNGDVRTLVKQLNYRSMWNEWRQNNISSAVARYSKKIHSVNPDLIISAAVVSNLQNAREIYMQDWYKWVRAGHIDMLAPMIYTGSSDAVRNDSLDIIEKLGNLTYLVSGIAPIYYGYSTMINHNQILATNPASGVAIFASQNVVGLEDVEMSLINGRNRYESVSISDRPNKIIDSSLNNLLLDIRDYYLPRNLIDESSKEIIDNEIKNILSMDIKNPKYLGKILERINVLSNLSLYIQNEQLREVYSDAVDSLYNVIDIKISRYLINNSYWDPSDDESRPDISKFDFPDFDDDIDNEEPNEVDPNEEMPDEEEPIEEDKKSNLIYYILSGIAGLILIFTSFIIYRKKVAR